MDDYSALTARPTKSFLKLVNFIKYSYTHASLRKGLQKLSLAEHKNNTEINICQVKGRTTNKLHS